MRGFGLVLVGVLLGGIVAQGGAQGRGVDSDLDGLNDATEQALLVQFQPTFMIGQHDCSNIPAEFQAGMKTPKVQSENGTIYGQVFPAKGSTAAHPMAEIHYYHLWRQDCGGHGHPLDTEHVSALMEATGGDAHDADWKAIYWYAAAHENTVCDVSQIARAKTLHAEARGAKVWISPNKHASYLNETLCQRGCGADRCEQMTELPKGAVINLGEASHPMNGSLFVASAAWPLEVKMTHTNFPAEPVARLNALPETDIAWFNAGRHPAQQIISISAATEGKLADSGANTTSAISLAGDQTGNALQKSYYHTKHALGTTAAHVGRALRLTPKDEPK
jgi:hypothetical protein